MNFATLRATACLSPACTDRARSIAKTGLRRRCLRCLIDLSTTHVFEHRPRWLAHHHSARPRSRQPRVVHVLPHSAGKGARAPRWVSQQAVTISWMHPAHGHAFQYCNHETVTDVVTLHATAHISAQLKFPEIRPLTFYSPKCTNDFWSKDFCGSQMHHGQHLDKLTDNH